MHDKNVISVVNFYADGVAHRPHVWQGFRPIRVDQEVRCHYIVAGSDTGFLQF